MLPQASTHGHLQLKQGKSGGNGVATPGHTRACAHVKFTGARMKIMWKARVKDQLLLACAITLMWT